MVSRKYFLGKIPLGCQGPGRILPAYRITIDQTTYSGSVVGKNQDNPVHIPFPACLKKKRDLDKDHLAICLAYQSMHAPARQGMEQPVHFPAKRWSAKKGFSQSSPVKAAIGMKENVAKPLSKGLPARLALIKKLAAEEVKIDQGKTKSGCPVRGHPALA
jgi:hypothetical protein